MKKQNCLGVLKQFNGNKTKEVMKNEEKIGLGAAFGVAIGSAIGVVTDNLELWIGLGIAIGVGIAISLKQKTDKTNKNE